MGAFLTGVFFVAIIALLTSIMDADYPRDYHWERREPWPECPDCHGTGRIEVGHTGSGQYIDCPCTMKLTK